MVSGNIKPSKRDFKSADIILDKFFDFFIFPGVFLL